MATTVRQIIDAAYATSKKNQPGAIASETGELLEMVNRSLRGFFAEGARHNRKFFGRRIEVEFNAGASGGWQRPEGAESVVRIEAGDDVKDGAGSTISAGTQIVEVPFDQRNAEPGKPCIYSYGQVYYSAGNERDPAEGDLIFFCSMRPALLTALEGVEGTLDPLWPEQFNQLLILDVARYLAVKDGGREDEVAAFAAEYEREHQRYIEFLQHESTTEVKSWGHFNRINPPSIVVG